MSMALFFFIYFDFDFNFNFQMYVFLPCSKRNMYRFLFVRWESREGGGGGDGGWWWEILFSVLKMVNGFIDVSGEFGDGTMGL